MHSETATILLIEDDDELAALLVEYLELQGFEVSREDNGASGLAALKSKQPDLVILDLMLPQMNGLDLLRQARSEFDGAFVMLTASQSEVDHVAGLELGADDFVVKPIDPRVLLARIRTQLRRMIPAENRAKDGKIIVGALSVDLLARDVTCEGHNVPLTTMEFDVLSLLARDAGSVVQRDELYTEIMGVEYDGIDRGMDVHVSRIRRKLEVVGFDSSRLKAIRGVGYLLAFR